MINSPAPQSQFVMLAHKYGLSRVPQNTQELFTALQGILSPSQMELINYLFQTPEQYTAANPFGSPDLPGVAAAPTTVQPVLPTDSFAAAQAGVTTAPGAATGGDIGTPEPPKTAAVPPVVVPKPVVNPLDAASGRLRDSGFDPITATNMTNSIGAEKLNKGAAAGSTLSPKAASPTDANWEFMKQAIFDNAAKNPSAAAMNQVAATKPLK